MKICQDLKFLTDMYSLHFKGGFQKGISRAES